jgi:hypothetical protein
MTVGRLNPEAFADSIAQSQPPVGLSLALEALWWDAKGDWEKAHQCAQARDDASGMRVHAYLHRKEGDQSNAAYWYRRCDATPSTLALDAEWEELVRAFLMRDRDFRHAMRRGYEGPSSPDPQYLEALQVNDAASQRMGHRLCATVGAELVGDGSHVEFYGAGGDAEAACDLLVRGAVHQEFEHIAFAR